MVAQMLSHGNGSSIGDYCQINTMKKDRKRSKTNDGKAQKKKSTQNNGLLELENNICWTKKSFKNFRQAGNRSQQKAKKL
jgi:hypothetical protein